LLIQEIYLKACTVVIIAQITRHMRNQIQVIMLTCFSPASTC